MYLTSIEMIGDAGVGDEPGICLCLLLCCQDYLGELVREAAFFPSNDTFCPFLFFFLLPCSELLLLALQLGDPDLDDFFGVLFLLLEFLRAFDFLAMGVPFRRLLFGFVPSLLTFLP